MEFNPNNHVIRRCMQGIDLKEKGKPEEAGKLFLQAWSEATNDVEKFTAAFYVARHQKNVSDRLKWFQTALQLASGVNSDWVMGAVSSLHLNIAKCYHEMGALDNEKMHNQLAISLKDNLPDKGPFYHGTKADLKIGDLLTPGGNSNYKSGVVMNHIYFTALVNGAGLAAALAAGDNRERVYIVEPTGAFENDPNVTDKRFPGNPTRSYRSLAPLKITGEVTAWTKLTPEELQKWREKLANNKGEIIN